MEEQKLSNREYYLLKQKEKEEGKVKKEKNKKLRKIFFVFLPLGLISVGIVIWVGSFIYAKISAPRDLGLAKIEIPETEFDAGSISMKNGLYKHDFTIKNVGQGNLKIEGIRTTCHCTTAVLKVGNRVSPTFGMQDNPLFWSEKIPANETGTLEVTFDPNFHGPDSVGPIVREVFFSTNDPKAKNAKVQLSGDVVH